MRVAFVKKGGTFFAKLIRLWTWGAYSHAEIVFHDGSMFSSDEADGGSRFIPGPKPGIEYDYLDITTTAEMNQRVLDFCQRENGCKYDMRGIAFSFLPVPIGLQSADRWFCSEVCVAALQQIGYMVGHTPSSVSPNALYKLLSKELSV